MANPAHEALLHQGLSEWNEWRASNASVVPDLAGLSLCAGNLRGVDLSRACLQGATLIRTRLEGSDFRFADLRGAQLHEADFTDCDLLRANLDDAILPGAKLRRARLTGATMRRSQVTVVDLRDADLREADFEGADLRESHAAGARFGRANLKGAEVFGLRLTNCDLRGARGLTSRQLETAIVEDTTLLPESLGAVSGDEPGLGALRAAAESLLARSSGPTVAESVVSSYNALLAKLESRGFEVARARIVEGELRRPVSSWERTAGGEAFEVAPVREVDAVLFRSRLGAVLEDIRRRER
jgi:uncharacterized protein YjbI with pentapeptide repeats